MYEEYRGENTGNLCFLGIRREGEGLGRVRLRMRKAFHHDPKKRRVTLRQEELQRKSFRTIFLIRRGDPDTEF